MKNFEKNLSETFSELCLNDLVKQMYGSGEIGGDNDRTIPRKFSDSKGMSLFSIKNCLSARAFGFCSSKRLNTQLFWFLTSITLSL